MFSFGKIDQISPDKDVVQGELAIVPTGIAIAPEETVCDSPPIGVPIDAPDEEKDANLNFVSTCRRHCEKDQLMT